MRIFRFSLLLIDYLLPTYTDFTKYSNNVFLFYTLREICACDFTKLSLIYKTKWFHELFYTGQSNFRFTIQTNPQVLLDYGFDANKKTKFIAHGWVVDGESFAHYFAEGKNMNSTFPLHVIDITSLCLKSMKPKTLQNLLFSLLVFVSLYHSALFLLFFQLITRRKKQVWMSLA